MMAHERLEDAEHPQPVTAKGLSSSEAAARLRDVGPNQVDRERATSPLWLLAFLLELTVYPAIFAIWTGKAIERKRGGQTLVDRTQPEGIPSSMPRG
jgi:hypothetical protein